MSSKSTAACLTLLSTYAASAQAVELGALGGETPTIVDVTEATTLSYNASNRNARRSDVASQADDNWGLWYNRLNLQANRGAFQLSVRLDSAWFYASRYPEDIALDLLRLEHDGQLPPSFDDQDAEFFVRKFVEAGQESSTRFTHWVYPAKYKLRYASDQLEVSLGDDYVQLGRGLVLSVRKIDELSGDTTVRGVRVSTSRRLGDYRLAVLATAGVLNPLRIDEASGRYLGVDDPGPSWVGLLEAGSPRIQPTAFAPERSPTYTPDRLGAAGIQFGNRNARLGLQGSLLARAAPLSRDVVRSADRITTSSVSLDLPNLGPQGAGYFELAFQDLSHSDTPAQDLDGVAFYTSVTSVHKPLTLTFEGKHYRRFFPLRANVDVGRAREFTPVQYSAPPTTQAFWNDTEFEGFNTCVTGGRLQSSVQLGPHQSVFFWGGHYRTWAETSTNENCDTARGNLNLVWDWATGLEIDSDQRRSHASAQVGTRFDSTAEPFLDNLGRETSVFYREGYVRYDVTRWLGQGYALHFTGWHRRRHQTIGAARDPWLQGQSVQALQWEGKLSVALGLEYDTNPAFPTTYVNGQVSYNISSASNIALFVGQRQGGLRCVAGVCRIFPPFEGARLDGTLRF